MFRLLSSMNHEYKTYGFSNGYNLSFYILHAISLHQPYIWFIYQTAIVLSFNSYDSFSNEISKHIITIILNYLCIILTLIIHTQIVYTYVHTYNFIEEVGPVFIVYFCTPLSFCLSILQLLYCSFSS